MSASEELKRYHQQIEWGIEELLVQGHMFWDLVMAKGHPSENVRAKALKHFKLVAKLPDGTEKVLDETWIFLAKDLREGS